MTEAAVTETAIFERVVTAIVEINPDVDGSTITPDTSLESLEMDSLDLVELAQIMDEAYGVELGSDALGEIVTVGDAAALIGREIA